MPTAFDRLLEKWADQNVAGGGRGRNAIRFVVFMLAAGLMILAGIAVSRSQPVIDAIGQQLAGVAALILLVGTFVPLGLALVCLIMSLMNAVRNGRLG